MYPLYQDASSVLEQAGKRKGTLSRLSLAPSIRNKKATLALAAETTRLSNLIDECMKTTGLASEENRFKPFLLKVLVYEILLGKKKIQGGGEASRLVKGHREGLVKALGRQLEKRGIKSVDDLSRESAHRPSHNLKYLRVNVLRTTMAEVVEGLLADSWEQLSHQEFMQTLSMNKSKVFCLDPDFDDLLMLRSTSDFHKSQLVGDHFVRIQEKASCMPARVMMEDNDIEFALDACAAPGNKTTHLSALMGNRGKIVALDINQDRVKLLQETVEKMGASNITVMKKDFLSVSAKVKPFSHVQGILLDPSCSGSGIVGREERMDAKSKEKEEERLQRLCAFQKKALLHALSFPNVRRVVYSTCSIHQQENEDVVESCLEARKADFELKRILPNWSRRGLPVFPDADKCVRVTPEEHSMGFFVACFVRKNPSSDESVRVPGQGDHYASTNRLPPSLSVRLSMSLRRRMMHALLRVYGRRAVVKVLRLMK